MSFLDLFDFASAKPPEPDAEVVDGAVEDLSPTPRRTIPPGMNPEFEEKVAKLIEAAAAAGIEINRGGGFRTREEQARLYAEKPNLAAPPGHSLHEKGLAYDLTYGKGGSDWAHEHAGEFGLRFPMSYEPWHIQLAKGNAPVKGIAAAKAPVIGVENTNPDVPLPIPRPPDLYAPENIVNFPQPIEGAQDEALAQMLSALAQKPQDTEMVSAPPIGDYEPLVSPLPPLSPDQELQKAYLEALSGGAPIPETPEEYLSEIGHQAGQFGTGFLEMAGGMPGALLAGAAALPALAARKTIGWEGPAKVVELGLAERELARKGAEWLTGVKEPVGTAQKVARFGGQVYVPGSPLASGAQAAMTFGVPMISRLLERVNPEPRISKPVAEAIMFPRLSDIPLPGPRVTHTIQTLGGPAKISDNDLWLMGGLFAATAGAIFAPKIIEKIKANPLPVYRPVREAAPGTLAISDRIDLMRTADDINAGVLRAARRAGMDSTVLTNITNTMQIQTNGGARSLVNSAISTGKMETPSFRFESKVPLTTLARFDNPTTAAYLNALNTYDDILWLEAKGKGGVGPELPMGQEPRVGPVTVRGMTKQTAIDLIKDMEKAQPQLKEYAAAYFDNVDATRKFLSTGEYATLAPTELQRLNQTSKHYVPWRAEGGGGRVFDNADAVRLPPTDSLQSYMTGALRGRLENEARGMYVDEMRKINPKFFVPVDADTLARNANWKKNTVEIFRRGEKEYYTTDPFIADVFRLDPYAITGTLHMAIYSAKRAFETTTTGLGAPGFAITDAIRSYATAKLNVPEGRTSPSAVGAIAAVPRQLLPQFAEFLHEKIDAGSGGWLESVFGPEVMQALSLKLRDTYANSLVAQLETVGTHKGSYLQHEAVWSNRWKDLIDKSTGTPKAFFEGYKNTLDAIHNGTQYDYVFKNQTRGLPLSQLALEARNIVADPTVAGRTYSGGKYIRMDKPTMTLPMTNIDVNIPNWLQSGLMKGARGYTTYTEFGRQALPWFNTITQGVKNLGQNYLDNPAKFVGRLWLYELMPTAAVWFWNRGLGLDPNGVSYNDYQMNGRTPYNTQLNQYIGLPGRPVSEGIELPLRPHETTPFNRLMEVALDHMAGTSVMQSAEDYMRTALDLVGVKDTFPKTNQGALFSPQEDLQYLAQQAAGVFIDPSTPPILNAWDAWRNRSSPMGIFGGAGYTPHNDPYDQLTPGPHGRMELLARALGTGLADVVGSTYAAFLGTPKEEGYTKAVMNGMRAGARRQIMKTPIVRDIAGIHNPQTGNVRIVEELFAKERALNDLMKFYKTWSEQEGVKSIKPRSISGGEAVTELLGPGPSTGQTPGMDQPLPTNPLYRDFVAGLDAKLKHDTTTMWVDPATGERLKRKRKGAVEVPDPEGGIGIMSAWARYSDYNDKLKSMRPINEGNYVTWQMQLGQKPEALKELKENRIDYKNPTAVKNFYQQRRLEVARMILFSIRAVEEAMSEKVGRPIHIEDLNPYGEGVEIKEEANQ